MPVDDLHGLDRQSASSRVSLGLVVAHCIAITSRQTHTHTHTIDTSTTAHLPSALTPARKIPDKIFLPDLCALPLVPLHPFPFDSPGSRMGKPTAKRHPSEHTNPYAPSLSAAFGGSAGV